MTLGKWLCLFSYWQVGSEENVRIKVPCKLWNLSWRNQCLLCHHGWLSDGGLVLGRKERTKRSSAAPRVFAVYQVRVRACLLTPPGLAGLVGGWPLWFYRYLRSEGALTLGSMLCCDFLKFLVSFKQGTHLLSLFWVLQIIRSVLSVDDCGQRGGGTCV